MILGYFSFHLKLESMVNGIPTPDTSKRKNEFIQSALCDLIHWVAIQCQKKYITAWQMHPGVEKVITVCLTVRQLFESCQNVHGTGLLCPAVCKSGQFLPWSDCSAYLEYFQENFAWILFAVTSIVATVNKVHIPPAITKTYNLYIDAIKEVYMPTGNVKESI